MNSGTFCVLHVFDVADDEPESVGLSSESLERTLR